MSDLRMIALISSLSDRIHAEIKATRKGKLMNNENMPLRVMSQFSPSSLIMLDGGVSTEMQTGRRIYDRLRDKRDYGTLKHFGLQRHKVCSADELRQQLHALEKAARPGAAFILHLEFHGDEHGIEIGDQKERIFWRELMRLLSKINDRTRCNLGLVLAGCDGWGSFKVEDFQEPAAFRFQLCHPGKVDAEIIQHSLEKFYDLTFSVNDLEVAALAAAPFRMKHAEEIFASLMYHVCRTGSRAKIKQAHISATLTNLLARGGIGGNNSISPNRQAIKTHYGSFEQWVRKCITQNLRFFCGREPAYTVDELADWIISGPPLRDSATQHVSG